MWATPLRCPHIHRPSRVARAISAWRGHTVFERPVGLIETGTAPTATAKSRIDAVPLHRAEHVCRGSIPFVVVRVHIQSRLERRPLRRGGFYVFGAGLQFWSAATARPDLLCGRLCT